MSGWREGDVVANGIRLHYYRGDGLGAASGQPVVFCHGYSSHALTFGPVARELQSDYDVILADARYHGHSEAPREDAPDAMSHDLAGLIQALGLDRPVAVGHSMGAMTVFGTAALYPDRVRGISLEDPGWVAEPGSRPRRDFAAELAHFQSASLDELRAEYRAANPDWTDEIVEQVAVAKKLLSPDVTRRARSSADWRERLARIKCPVLLFTGDPALGAIVTDAVVEEATRIAPQIQRVAMPGLGHEIRYGGHGRYVAALKAFVASVFEED